MPSVCHLRARRLWSFARTFAAFLLLTALRGVVASAPSSPAELGVERDVWLSIRKDDLPGSGTRDDPFNASGERFDVKMREVANNGTNVHIHLMPGLYDTMGYRVWHLRTGAKLSGAGMDVTIIRMTNAANSLASVICNSSGQDTHIEVSDLTIDCNHTPDHPNLGNAIILAGSHHTIRRVRGINAAGYAIENFVIAMTGVGLISGNSEGNLIEDCEVTDFKGTYATGISFAGPNGINRFISGTIRNNRVLNLRNTSSPANLHAYGGGGMKNVLFENNYSFRCDVAANLDTHKSVDVTFKGNQFHSRRRGILLIGQHLDGIVIENNVIEIESTGADYALYCYDVSGQSKLRNFMIRDNIIRSANGRSGLGGGLALGVVDGQSWIVRGNRVDSSLRSYIHAPGMSCFDNTDLTGRPIRLIPGPESMQVNLPVGEAGTLLLNKGSAYIIAETSRDAAQNGLNLVNAYAKAKVMSPQNQALSAANRATVFLLPGTYSLGDSALVLDTPFVDIAGVGSAGSVRLESAGNVIVQTADDVEIENLTAHCMWSGPLNYTASDKAAYFPADNLTKARIKKCIFSATNNGLSMRVGITYAGTYENCDSGPYGFGAGNFRGTAKDCTAGHFSFGGSGVLTRCQIAGAINPAIPTTGKLSDCRVGPVPDNSPCIVLGDGASLYNCTLIANPVGSAFSVDAPALARAKVVHSRMNRGMRNILNLVAQPGNVDDPTLD